MESRIVKLISKTKLLPLCRCSNQFSFTASSTNFPNVYSRLTSSHCYTSSILTKNSHNISFNCNQYKPLTVHMLTFTSQHDSVEKKLRKHMDMWEMEKAVELMRGSILEGEIPHNNLVLDLLQQLANLGETECLLNLHDFLRERNLVTDTKFFKCLQEAYYNSGRVDEGVSVLRILYHRTRKYREVEAFFCLLAVMVLRNFPDRIDLIEGFVTDLREFEDPVTDPIASLWKCYLLTENFDKADEYLLQNEEIQSFVPQMVNDICAKVNKIDANYAKVFEHLIDAPYIKPKQKPLVRESHAETLCESGQLEAAVQLLCKTREEGVHLHPTRVRQIVAKIQQDVPHSGLDSDIGQLLLWCDQMDNS